MVSFWPWKADENSAESFEKTLAAVSDKISKATAQNDSLRQRARKLKVGWILYGGVAYIVAFLILTLVTGWQNWGSVEYSTIAGGPVLLYIVRSLLTSWYNYRITHAQEYLDSLYKQRDETIEKLKQATKYNSTQKLLEKYASARPSPGGKEGTKPSPKAKNASRRSTEGRTNIPPPPTANIPRNQKPARLSDTNTAPLPASPPPNQELGLSPTQPFSPSTQPPGEDFAPNAFDAAPQFSSSSQLVAESRWYDRILDALLGEDEAQAKNRLALICKHCRVVNGLAPPGMRTLQDVGKWRCSNCGRWNGEEFDTAQLMKEVSATQSRKDVVGSSAELPLLNAEEEPQSPSVGSSFEAFSAEEE